MGKSSLEEGRKAQPARDENAPGPSSWSLKITHFLYFVTETAKFFLYTFPLLLYDSKFGGLSSKSDHVLTRFSTISEPKSPRKEFNTSLLYFRFSSTVKLQSKAWSASRNHKFICRGKTGSVWRTRGRSLVCRVPLVSLSQWQPLQGQTIFL